MSPLSQSLAALAQQRKLAGSLASLVRAEMPAIETARRAGLSYAQICQGFAALGIEASARTLRHTVYRIQAEQRRQARSAHPLPDARHPATDDAPVAPGEPAPSSPHPSAPGVLPCAVDPVPARPAAAPPDARQPGPSPGFVRDIINTPIDMDEIARQYRSSSGARRTAANSDQAPPAATAQGNQPR